VTLILPKLNLASEPLPDHEKLRLEELYSMDVLDVSSDERFNRYTELVTSVLSAPIAAIVLMHEDRLIFKALHGRDLRQAIDREVSFAAHAMQQGEMLVVEDALKDARFAEHPLVKGKPGVRAYAGSVIRGSRGQPLGAICVMDTAPRSFTAKECSFLQQITHMLEHELETRQRVAELKSKIRDHILLDNATQLPTETLFTARLARNLEKYADKPIMLALIRLERFEAIHSAVGKPGAAHLVKEVTARLKQVLSRPCLFGRTREDTIVLAFALNDQGDPVAEIHQMLECFSSPFLLGDRTVAQNVGIATALHPRDGHDSDTLLRRARTALNSIPPADVSRFRQYHRGLSADAARQFEIETALRGAIERDELELVYQPKVSVRDGSLVGAEALLRWVTPRLGMVGPSEFIPIAEESGLIVQLGDWALATACRQLANWRDLGHDCPEVSVNVSSVQLRERTFCDRVAKLLNMYQLPGSKLNLEVTEGTLIENIGEAIKIMTELQSLGITLSIDDFGKGFSSLSYLARMPVQSLKIDRSFVQGIPEEHTSMTLVRSIVAMGHGLGLTVVAEGVETEAQRSVLEMAACDQIQGFLISQPIDTDSFRAQFLTATPASEAAEGP
jgi:EAL domain-containing protein (putative c-di-GMP-specific phosphodiesterase class I)/GGDEF domain-containing protein